MSKAAAIQSAVWSQLSADGQKLPQTGQEVMGTDYKYNITTIRGFLNNVSIRLTTDIPSLNFQWETLDPAQCINDSIFSLCCYISTATS